jgi:hypothetical protein
VIRRYFNDVYILIIGDVVMRLFKKGVLGKMAAVGSGVMGSGLVSAQSQSTAQFGTSGSGQGIPGLFENLVNTLGQLATQAMEFGTLVGGLLIIYGLWGWYGRSKKGTAAQNDTFWQPAAIFVGALLIMGDTFIGAASESVTGQDGAKQVQQYRLKPPSN